ncbi:DDE superfamily endonuclease [Natrinema hispanicum]|uniref:DDE superfamily endonuclease n=1 Tax=Natrinema hispanicum TaxID=392421 RepID=A0A1I0I760_9EURY|nr:DDE superfamily endonuclease [Natrinema hispanicum]SET92408.1 DDE superfamily endonuclease [Natrinema hispanicum]
MRVTRDALAVEKPIWIVGDSAYDTLEWHDPCDQQAVVPIGPYNPRNTDEPLEIEYRVEGRIEVTKRRRKQEFVQQMQSLVDDHYPDAVGIRVVMDNLNTHQRYAFYEHLPPEEARRLLNKLEFHFTLEHGSWLNMAEIEFSALWTECLDRRIPDAATLRAEVAAWERTRNEDESTIDWQFTTDDARIKLRQL